MKICPRCGAAFPTQEPACPSCLHAPAIIEGFRAFAPELAENSEGFAAEFFPPLFALEEKNFWFRSRNRCIGAGTRLIPDLDSVRDVIEHGCGTGYVLAELQRIFPRARVVGTELAAKVIGGLS